MTSKNVYWIADPEGVKACVSGDAIRDFWVRMQGYTETTEPVGDEFQWVRNRQHGGRGVMNHAATLLHAGLGWYPSDPPPVPGLPENEPADTSPPVKSVPPPAAISEGVTPNA